MTLVRRMFALHLAVAAAALAAGFWISGSFVGALAAALAAFMWYYTSLRSMHGYETALLLVFVLGAAGGYYWLSISPLLILLTAVASLGAWDLDYFLQRLKTAEHVEGEQGLGISHLRRLATTEALGLLLGVIAAALHTTVSFWLAVVLVLLGVVGVSQLILYVRRQME